MFRKTQGISVNYIFRSLVIDENRCQKNPYKIWLVIAPGIEVIVLSEKMQKFMLVLL